MLSKRLNYILNEIPLNKVYIIADIGTDHAYLPIEIIKSKKAKFVYAVDINEKPLLSAKANIDKANYSNKIKTVLSDGLNFVANNDITTIDYVTIAGIGSQTINEILKKDSNKVKNYLICSNTPIVNIRQWAKTNNFNIVKEDFIIDDKHNYWFMSISKNSGFKRLKKSEMIYGGFEFFKNNQLYKNYLISEIEKLTKIISKINNDKHRVKTLAKQRKQLEKYLNGINKNN